MLHTVRLLQRRAAWFQAATISHAAFQILEAGGNAVDAGVAAGLVLGVVHSDQVNIAGVAPMMIYLAEQQKVITIDGLGGWPAAASSERFEQEFGGVIPEGLLRTVIPAAPAAWITALRQYGTMTFGEVAAAAIRFARRLRHVSLPGRSFARGRSKVSALAFERRNLSS